MPERQVLTALTGTVAPLLTVDTTIQEALDYASMHLPREWKKTVPFVKDDVELLPNNVPSLAQDVIFSLPKLGTFVGDMIVRIDLPPITVTPLGNPAFYVDFPGFSFIENLTITFGANKVWDITAYDLWFYYRRSQMYEETINIDTLVYGNTTTAQRSALLLAGTPVQDPIWVPTWAPFTNAQDTSHNLPLIVLSQKTQFILRTPTLLNLTQTPIPGTSLSTAGQFDFRLILKVIHSTGPEAAALLEMSRADDGIAYIFHQHIRQISADFANTTTNFEIVEKLSSVTKPVKSLIWGIIPTKLINDTGRNDKFFFQPQAMAPIPPGQSNYSRPITWFIDANGQYIQRPIPCAYSRKYKYYFYDKALIGDETHAIHCAEFPWAKNAASGYLDFTNLNNPVLHIFTGVGGTGTDPDIPANPQALRIVINAQDYNFWFFKSGNWSRTFN